MYRMPRDPLDRYYTPPWATRLLLERLRDHHGYNLATQTIGEPFAGAGHMVRELERVGARVIASDIDPGSPFETVNFLSTDAYSRYHGVDWLITNPPYNAEESDTTAVRCIRHALRLSCSVAMLLRLSFQEPCADREHLITSCPPDWMGTLPRVHYKGPGGGTQNNQTSVWGIWDKLSGEAKMHWWTRADKERVSSQVDLFDQGALL
jgi:hypothetical protein